MTHDNRYVTVEESGGVVILSIGLARIHDFEVAEAIGKALVSAALRKPAPKVVVDLSQLEYMSSVGYGPFLSLRARVLLARVVV
jgi:anti-anti-sigma factor